MESQKLSPINRRNLTRESIWSKDNKPDSLLNIAARSCVFQHLNMWTRVEDDSKSLAAPKSGSQGKLALKPDVLLPSEVKEKLVEVAQDGNFPDISSFIGMLKPRKLNLTDLSLTDDDFSSLLSKNVRQVSVQNCDTLTVQSLKALNRHSDNLVNLHINSKTILPDCLEPQGTSVESEQDGNTYIIRAPNLRLLNINNLQINRAPHFFEHLLKPLKGLTHLDLSGCRLNQGVTDIHWLKNCPRLVSLCLHNIDCGWDHYMAGVLTSLVHLEHLDISQADASPATTEDPEEFLRSLVTCLPRLKSLDISGTDLVRTSFPDLRKEIPGLESRRDRPLQFLGLYKTQVDACKRTIIPAREVTGDHNINQLIEAARRYMHRPKVMKVIMRDLECFIKSHGFTAMKEALEIIIQAMERHLNDVDIQISACYLISVIFERNRHILEQEMNVKMLQMVLSVLLNVILKHQDVPRIVKFGCYAIYFLPIQGVQLDLTRLIPVLLPYVMKHTEGLSVNIAQGNRIFELQWIIPKMDVESKKLLASLGGVAIMLNAISNNLGEGACEPIIKSAWTILCNITEDIPANCWTFLTENGLELFLRCKARFPNNSDLLTLMMRTICNVDEFQELRPFLMISSTVEEILSLLDYTCDTMEVSDKAGRVLANMVSLGETAWTIKSPSRSRVLSRLANAIERWDNDVEHTITYRSLKPFIRLLTVIDTPECQLWAARALAHFTKVTSEKYCKMVVDEGGLRIIEDVILNENLYPLKPTRLQDVKSFMVREDVTTIAQIVRENVISWRDQFCPVEENIE